MHLTHIPQMALAFSEFIEPLYLRLRWSTARLTTSVKTSNSTTKDEPYHGLLTNPSVISFDQDTNIQKLSLIDGYSIFSFIEKYRDYCPYTYLERKKDLEYLFNSGANVLGLKRNGKLIGYGVVSCNNQIFLTRLYKKYGLSFSELEPKSAIVINGVIAPEFRGRGYHKYLLADSEFHARSNNCNYIYAAVHDDNLPCLTNIRSFGYERISSLIEDGSWGLYVKKLR